MKKLAALLFSFALVFGMPAGAFASADKDCKDFKTWQEAQQYFESKGGSATNNVDRLDKDHDGLACENLPGFDSSHKNPNNGGNSGDTNTTPPSNGGTGNDNSANTGNNGNTGDSNGNAGNGGKLPKTATSYPTGLMAGALLLLAGAGLLMLKPAFARK